VLYVAELAPRLLRVEMLDDRRVEVVEEEDEVKEVEKELPEKDIVEGEGREGWRDFAPCLFTGGEEEWDMKEMGGFFEWW